MFHVLWYVFVALKCIPAILLNKERNLSIDLPNFDLRITHGPNVLVFSSFKLLIQISMRVKDTFPYILWCFLPKSKTWSWP